MNQGSTPVSPLSSPPPKDTANGDTGADSCASSSPSPNNNRTVQLSFMVLVCLAVLLSYADRTNMAIAIVPMGDEFDWSSRTRGLVLGAFFFGYIGTQIMGGWLADQWGGPAVLGGGVVVWSLVTLLTPIAARRAGLRGAVAARIGLGLAEGVGYPAIHSMMPRRVPSAWLNAAVAAVNSMSYVGGVVALLAAGPLAARLGWPSIFYVFGGLGLFWIGPWVIWTLLYGKTPTVGNGHTPGASDLEPSARPGSLSNASESGAKKSNASDPPVPGSGQSGDHESARYPASKRRLPGSSSGPEDQERHQYQPSKPLAPDTIPPSRTGNSVPWGRIFTSGPVWALFTAQYCNCWGFWMILSWLPSYFRERFGMALEDLGLVSVLPYAMQGLVGMAVGFGGDALLARRLIRKRLLRSGAHVVATIGPAVCLLGLLHSGLSLAGATALVTLAMALNAASTISTGVNHMDLAPRHAGTLFGVCNTVAVLPGILGVPLTGWILESSGGRWELVFGIAVVHYVVGCILWCWLGSVKIVIE